jgi:hypothetical protein
MAEGPVRQRAAESLINRWGQTDPYRAAAWLGTLPQGASRDSTVVAFSRQISANDPQSAVEWAQTIGNDATRNSQLESIVTSWVKTDAKSAMAWIAQSSLPQNLKDRLMNRGG